MLYLKLLNISEVVIEQPYKGTEYFPNKISILDVEDRGNYYNISYQITSMENDVLNLFNNDQLYIIPCLHERRTYASYNNKVYDGQTREVRYLLPRTFRTLVNIDRDRLRPLGSRIGTVSISKDDILDMQPRMSPSEYRRFRRLNFAYFNIKIKLDLSKGYNRNGGSSARGRRKGPRFDTSCDTIVFKCAYGQAS